MTLTYLPQLLAEDPGLAEVLERVRARAGLAAGQTDHVDITAVEGVRPAMIAAISQAMGEARRELTGAPGPHPPVVAITTSTSAAEDLAAAAAAFMPADLIAVLPAWETLPHERLSPRPDTLGRRTAVFRRLARPDPSGPRGPIELLVTPLRSVLQPVVKGLGEIAPVSLRAGDQADLTKVAERLAQLAYSRVDMVTRRGEFAVRGGILDVFPPTEDHPVRLDFWGDEVDECRYFAVLDQRSADLAEGGLWATACRELLITDAVKARAKALAPRLPGVADMLDRIAQGMPVEGMESLTPVLADALVPALQLAPPGALMLFCDPERLRRRAEDLIATAQEFLEAAWEAAAVGAANPVDLAAGSFLTLDQLHAEAEQVGCGWWTAGAFQHGIGTAPLSASPAPPAAVGPELTLGGGRTASGNSTKAAQQSGEPADAVRIALGVRELENYHGQTAKAVRQLKKWARDGWRVVLTTEGAGPAKRLAERLGGEGVAARAVADLDQANAQASAAVLVTTAAGRGFLAPGLKLAVVSERDLTGRTGATTRDMRRMPSRRKAAVDPLQLKAGDLVVHQQHGIGRFAELVSRTIGAGEMAATREYLVIEYAASKRGQPGDRLYVPTDSLDQVT
ncbi:MAG: hypothetical protein LBD90_04540, partial [Bifidobacteriaceae bacterium]|nr:hypothetical protein [Bifidobacteriaceae bacterium]